jgi:MFS family permease
MGADSLRRAALDKRWDRDYKVPCAGTTYLSTGKQDMDISHIARGATRWFRSRLSAPATLEDRNIRLIFVDTAWNGVVTAGVGTFLSVFMAREGASSLLISMLTALPALLAVVISLPASAWVERQHDHVRTTTWARIWFRGIYFVPAILPFFVRGEPMLVMIVVFWCIQAIPLAFTVPAWTSVMGATISPRRRAAVNGGRWALVSVITAISVAVFGKLLDMEWLPSPLNYQVVFFFSGVAAFLSIGMFARIKMPVDYATTPQTRLSLREQAANLIAPMIHTPAFIKYLSATFFVRLGIATPVALYSIFWVRHLGASDTVIGLRTTVGQAALVAGYYLFGRIASRRGHRKVLLFSSIGLALYPAVTAVTPNQFWLLPAALLWGFFAGGINISFFEGLLGTTPPERRPSFAALNAAFANLAVFVGPILGSALLEWFDIQFAFFAASALHLVGAVLCWRLGVGKTEE